MMKKVLIIPLLLSLACAPVFSADPFDNFKANVQAGGSAAQTSLDNFTKDLGALLGGGTYHQGKTLGFPGFDIGIKVPTKKISDDNTIVKSADISNIPLPIAQAEIGLPLNIDLIARMGSLKDSTLVGYGLRYGVFQMTGLPSISVQAVMTNLDVAAGTNKFKAVNTNVSAVVSYGLTVITPYAGVGFDSTSVEPDSSYAGGLKGTASGTRIEAGINLTLLPFTYLQLGAAVAGGDTNATIGLGAAFTGF
jgi:hypothetical protein